MSFYLLFVLIKNASLYPQLFTTFYCYSMILNPAFSESCNTASSPPIKLSIWCDYINTKLIHINITAAIEPRLARVITTSVVALSRFLPCFRPFSLFHLPPIRFSCFFFIFVKEKREKRTFAALMTAHTLYDYDCDCTCLCFLSFSFYQSLWELQEKILS